MGDGYSKSIASDESYGVWIEGYTENVAQLDTQWTEFESWVATLDMPFFYVPGNHDLTNATQVQLWKKKFGRIYYHFIYKNVLFIQMDSEDPPDTNISDEQIAYVQDVLEQNKDVRWTLVFIHKPMWLYKADQWDRVDALLKDRPYYDDLKGMVARINQVVYEGDAPVDVEPIVRQFVELLENVDPASSSGANHDQAG